MIRVMGILRNRIGRIAGMGTDTLNFYLESGLIHSLDTDLVRNYLDWEMIRDYLEWPEREQEPKFSTGYEKFSGY
jgi:hypothetical protein